MPEKMNQSPAEMLNQNAAVAQNAEVPAPAAPVTPARQSYAEKVQGLTIDERNWMLAKSKAAAMAQLPEGFLPQTYTGNPGACAIACEMALRMGVSHLRHAEPLRRPWYAHMERQELQGPHRQLRPVCRPHPLPHGGRGGHRNLGVPSDRRGQAHRRKGRRPESHGQDAKDAGWWNKNGSYWPKMTEMMLKYRAAAYFARAECPEVLMGANIDYEVGAGDAEEEGAAHA